MKMVEGKGEVEGGGKRMRERRKGESEGRGEGRGERTKK